MRKIILAILMCISCNIATLMAEPLKIDGLTCENLKAPLAIDNTQPHFSWLNHATYNNARQTAYELQVGTDSVRLLHGKADCWQVCKQASTSVMVPYGGKQLHSGHLYYWRVRSWNDKGEVSDWSEIQPFGIGLLHTTDMRGKYIGMPLSEVACTSPIVRKIVYISPDKHKRLLLHVNSLGYHEVYVNGKKAGSAVLAPAVSQLNKRSLTVTYDITPMVRKGNNEIRLWLGKGWYRRNLGFAQYDGPLVRADLVEVLPGTMKHLCCTDASWKATASGYHDTGTWQALQFGGERVDGRILTAAQHAWMPVAVVPVHGVKASPQMCEPNAIIAIHAAKQIQRLKNDVWLVDFGQVSTAWLSLKMRGLRVGQEVKMEYTDNIVDSVGFCSQGESDSYISAGKGDELFQNKFHHHAFRYVKISGLTQLLSTDVHALQISGQYAETATFCCSDNDLNAIHDMIARTMRCLTFSGYMVDCPHLERMGYGGDGNSSTPTVQTFCNVAPTYYNWLQAWADTMGEDGNLPYVAPAGGGGGGAYWSAFMVKAPWRTYVNYADARTMKRYYDKMKRWIQYAQHYMKNGLLQPWPDDNRRMWFLGDWLAPTGVEVGGESAELTNNCVLSDCLGTMAKIAHTLGHLDDAAIFASQRDTLNVQIHNAFFHATDTTYATGSPLDMAYPLLVGAVPASLHSAVVQRIIASCYGRFNGHIAGGLVGTAIFTQWAIQQGQSQPEPSQLVYNMLKQRSYPGYLYMIDNNATTTWEYWNGERSHVHNCYNGIGLWFYQALGGIRPTDDGVGYQRVIIAPQCPKEVTWATTTRQTPYGLLRTEWRGSQLKAQIPVGVEAEVVWRGKRHIVGSGEWMF